MPIGGIARSGQQVWERLLHAVRRFRFAQFVFGDIMSDDHFQQSERGLENLMEKKKHIQKESRIEEELGHRSTGRTRHFHETTFFCSSFYTLHLLIKGDIKDLPTIVIHSSY